MLYAYMHSIHATTCYLVRCNFTRLYKIIPVAYATQINEHPVASRP